MPQVTTLDFDNTVKTLACDYCRSQKLRCTKEPSGCLRCVDEGLRCFYPSRKPMGRPKKHRDRPPDTDFSVFVMRLASAWPDAPFPNQRLQLDETETGAGQTTLSSGSAQTPAPKFRPCIEGLSNLMDNVDAALEGGHPSAATQQRNNYLPDHLSPPNPAEEGPFCCLGRIGACVDALSDMPDVWCDAVYTARRACRTVYEVLECPRCGVTSSRVQTTAAVLGPVFSLIANAYIKLSGLVEVEVVAATNYVGAGELVFDLESYGGLWGPMQSSGIDCQAHYNGLAMSPEAWRATVRALFRTDIYGADFLRPSEQGQTWHHHRGLWDFTEEMKHIMLAESSRSGGQGVVGSGAFAQVIEMAQSSLKRLVFA
ncbi:hypothetical protein B0H63DRAFT_445732 [Podospora didyma]|uniref:Zn(2)-C6 fungal-type domain-containing protein n=1 Tax=Podospora didyma TaxID=330526 RepID=A0AAE0NXK5_9PEZI|nr:hypothetical protein B0H63DRAFT_445732 [Podospora didyma]